MRKYAVLKIPFQMNEEFTIKRVMICHISDYEVCVLLHDDIDDFYKEDNDELFNDLQSAENWCNQTFGIVATDWIYISDPMPECMLDFIRPIRPSGNSYEFFNGQDWIKTTLDEKQSLKGFIEVLVVFDKKARKSPPFGFVYRPHFVVDGTTEYLGIQFYDLPQAPLGSQIHLRAQLMYPQVDYSTLKKGTHFLIKEGARTVGEGTVLEEAAHE